MTDYRKKELLEELYLNKQMSMRAIAEDLGCTPPTIKRWLDRHGILTRNQAGNGKKPWHSEDLLRRLYEEDQSVCEIASRFGCYDGTVEYWLTKFGVGGRDPPTDNAPDSPTYHYWRAGYETVRVDQFSVGVHRLVAVAEYGLDFVDDWSEYHVHHKNGIKWDNRPSNLEVLTPENHGRIHAMEGKQRASV